MIILYIGEGACWAQPKEHKAYSWLCAMWSLLVGLRWEHYMDCLGLNPATPSTRQVPYPLHFLSGPNASESNHNYYSGQRSAGCPLLLAVTWDEVTSKYTSIGLKMINILPKLTIHNNIRFTKVYPLKKYY